MILELGLMLFQSLGGPLRKSIPSTLFHRLLFSLLRHD
jgi:hypothetical protein